MSKNIYSHVSYNFVSQRLKFEKITKDHKQYLSEVLKNPKIPEAYNTGDKEDFINVEAQFSIIEDQWQKYGYGLYILFNNETSDFIGFAGYHNVIVDQNAKVDCFNNKANDLELYILLMPQHWRKGYGFEAISKLIEIAFEYLPFTNVIAYSEPKNVASIALIKKFNCKEEKKVMYNNKPHILYRIYKPLDLAATQKIILISDPIVTKIPVLENNEPLIDFKRTKENIFWPFSRNPK